MEPEGKESQINHRLHGAVSERFCRESDVFDYRQVDLPTKGGLNHVWA